MNGKSAFSGHARHICTYGYGISAGESHQGQRVDQIACVRLVSLKNNCPVGV